MIPTSEHFFGGKPSAVYLIKLQLPKKVVIGQQEPLKNITPQRHISSPKPATICEDQVTSTPTLKDEQPNCAI